VICADGKAIGEIAALYITGTDWRIESILIELRKEIADHIGVGRTVFRRGTIELPVSFIQSMSDTVVLTIDVERLREVHRAATPALVPTPEPAPT
jgi:hypothetical protein